MDLSLVDNITGTDSPFLIEHFEEIGSTSQYLCRNADKYSEFQVITADSQSAGRGRHNRQWESPGRLGLWFSILLRPELPPAKLQLASLFSATVLAETLQILLGENALFRIGVKWPNDLLLKDRKIAGILLNSSLQGDRLDYLVVGIGINLLQDISDFPQGLQQKAASIYQVAGVKLQREKVLGHFLKNFMRQYSHFQNKPDRVIRPFLERALYLGKAISLDDQGIRRHGIFTGITAEGHLILEDGDHKAIVTTGDVSTQ